MLRSYLEHNYFISLLKIAYEDGYTNEPGDHGPSCGASKFGEIAEKCAPARMPRIAHRSAISPLLDATEDKDLIDASLRREAENPYLLRDVIAEAWAAGANARWNDTNYMPGRTSFAEWKKLLADGPDQVQVRKKAEEYAKKKSKKYSHFLNGGNLEKDWKLEVSGAIIGWYHGPDLCQGDYIEYVEGAICKVCGIDRESRSATILKLGGIYDDATAGMTVPIIPETSMSYDSWRRSVLAKGKGESHLVGARNAEQSEEFNTDLKDRIEKLRNGGMEVIDLGSEGDGNGKNPKKVASNHIENANDKPPRDLAEIINEAGGALEVKGDDPATEALLAGQTKSAEELAKDIMKNMSLAKEVKALDAMSGKIDYDDEVERLRRESAELEKYHDSLAKVAGGPFELGGMIVEPPKQKEEPSAEAPKTEAQAPLDKPQGATPPLDAPPAPTVSPIAPFPPNQGTAYMPSVSMPGVTMTIGSGGTTTIGPPNWSVTNQGGQGDWHVTWEKVNPSNQTVGFKTKNNPARNYSKKPKKKKVLAKKRKKITQMMTNADHKSR